MSSKIKWTNNIEKLEAGALYVMENRGEWHVDVFPKDGILRDDTILPPDPRRAQFIGHPDTLYYGPIPWPDKELREWPPVPPPTNVIKIKNK